MKNLIYLYFLMCSLLFLHGCKNIDVPTPTPTYIHIDSFRFTQNPILGNNVPETSQITNVWVYYNNNPVGAFDMPCTIPIMANGNQQVELYPGISMDGLNEDPLTYPFYMPDTFTLMAQPGKIITHEPTTEYYSDIKPQKISNFIGAITSFAWAGGNVPMTGTSSDSLIEGSLFPKAAGTILLNASGDSSIDSSYVTLTIPTGTLDAYIEFDYKSSLPFYVGLQTNISGAVSSTPYYLTGIYPSTTWQKFYLNVADFNNQYQGTSYNFYIKASMPSGQTYGRVLIENIYLITF